MAFKEVADLDCNTQIALGGFNKKLRKDNPTSIVGYFIGSKQTPNKLSQSGFSFLHIFQTAEGNVGVWGKKDLDNKLADVTPGTMVRATFTHTVPTQKQPMFKFKVEVDKDNTIEVGSSYQAASASVAASYEDDSEDEASLLGDEQDVDVAPPARATAPAKPATVDANKTRAFLNSRTNRTA